MNKLPKTLIVILLLLVIVIAISFSLINNLKKQPEANELLSGETAEGLEENLDNDTAKKTATYDPVGHYGYEPEDIPNVVLADVVNPYDSITKEEILSQSTRRNNATDVPIEVDAKACIEDFKKIYPDVPIVKVRWQTVFGNGETYVIEGTKNGTKYILKYLKDGLLLGLVERELRPSEYDENGIPTEKPLDYDVLLSFTELEEIALKDLGGQLLELKITWEKDMPQAHAEAYEGSRSLGIHLYNAVTGEKIV